MTKHPLGTVAMVTACNAKTPYRAAFDGEVWRSLGDHNLCVISPTTIRPLVVLDLDGLVEPQVLANFIRVTGLCGSKAVGERLADQIEAAVKPPRIPEPGLYGVVSAHIGEGGPWALTRSEYGWVCLDDGTVHDWDSLIDPTLVRPGIEEES
jgi:hypothetical protein